MKAICYTCVAAVYVSGKRGCKIKEQPCPYCGNFGLVGAHMVGADDFGGQYAKRGTQSPTFRLKIQRIFQMGNTTHDTEHTHRRSKV